MDNDVVRVERSTDLIANFVDGYAAGWRFAVREAFRSALDIKWSSRMISTGDIDKSGKKITVEKYMWTQGKDFAFSKGDILYDTRLAYELNWADALRHMKLYVQVTEASPSLGGKMSFKVYRPLKNSVGVEDVGVIKCTQKSFVAFLKSGVITTLDYNIRDLFKEYA